MNPQEPYFTQLSIPLARTSPNLAPARPIAEAIKNKKVNLNTPSKFEDAVRKVYQAKLNYEKVAWQEMISMAQLVSLFRKGQQLLQRNPSGVGYYVRPIQNDDTFRQTAMNLMSFHAQVCEAKIIASNPNVNMRPGDDTPEAIAAAQACRPTVDYYESEWYTSKFSRREAIRLLTDGMFIHQVRWNPFKGEMQVAERTVSRQEQQIDPGAGMCADCQHEAEAEEFEPTDYGHKCPECGSEAVDVKPPVRQSMAQIGMGQPKPVGEPELISSAFASWRWDLSKQLEESPWAIKRQRISQGAINLMLGEMTIPDSQSSGDYGLDVLHALAYAGQAFQGSSATQGRGFESQLEKRPTMAEFWLSAEDQAEIEIDEGQTVAGIRMPSGRMSNFFKGAPVCIVGLNDMSLIVGVYAGESHQDEVVTAQWFMDAESGAGRGMEDTAAVQRRFNAVDGHIYKGLATTATPPVFVDMRMIKEDNGKYLFTPGVNHDVNLSVLPVGMKLPDAIYMPQPGAISQQYVQYGGQFLMQMLTMSALSVDFSENVLPVDNRTATGAQITAQLANSLYGPMLISKGESRVEIAEKIVRLKKKYGIVATYYPGKGNARGRSVSGADLKGKVIFELVQNSQLPVTPFSQQSDVQNLFLAFGGAEVALGIKKQDPEFFRATSRPYNIDWGNESDDDISTLCLGRLEQMKEAVQAGITDPVVLTEQMIRPPVSAKEPKHKEKQQWWSDWLDLDSAQKAPLVLRQAAEAMWNLHENLMMQTSMPQAANVGLVAGIGEAAAQAPTALGAAALQQQQPEQQVEDKTLEIESKMAMDEAKHKTDLELKEMEGETQRDVARIQGANAEKTTKLAGENAVKVAKAKPRPKPSKAAA